MSIEAGLRSTCEQGTDIFQMQLIFHHVGSGMAYENAALQLVNSEPLSVGKNIKKNLSNVPSVKYGHKNGGLG
jgi:hypothetical protein